MKFVVLIGLFILLQTNAEMKCNNYKTADLPDGTCLSVQDSLSTTQAKACETGEECTFDPVNKVGTCSLQTFYPGEPCTKGEQCKSSACENNVCKGNAQDAACEENLDCQPGLYCNSDTKTCAKQLILGAECKNIWECQNDLVCNGQTCVKFFSDPLDTSCLNHAWGNNFLQDIDGFSFSCSTMYCLNAKCATAPKSQQQKKVCTVESDCSLSGGATGKCLCDVQNKNVISTGVCQTQAGDDLALDWQINMDAYVIPHLSNTNDKCNTEGRFRYQCWQQTQKDTQVIKSLAAIFSYDWFAMVNGGYNVRDNDDAVIQNLNVAYDLYSSYKLLSDTVCYPYQCATTLVGKKCQTFDSKTNTYSVLQQCQINDDYCPSVPMGAFNDSYCQKKIQESSTLAAGMFCRNGNECMSGTCSDLWKCVGLKQNDACSGNDDNKCDVGLTCIQKTCQPQIQVQDQERKCETDLHCVNNAVCRAGQCLLMLSQADNIVIKGATCDDKTKRDIVCQSFTCDSDAGDLKCVTAYKSSPPTVPIKTNTQYDCKSSSGDNQYFAELNCDYGKGSSYCALHTGDTITLAYTSALKALLDVAYTDQGKCHTSERLSVSCWEYDNNKNDNLAKLASYYKAFYEWKYFPALDKTAGAALCTQTLYWQEYIDASVSGYTAMTYPSQNTDVQRECASTQGITFQDSTCKKLQTVKEEQYWLYQVCKDTQVCTKTDDSSSNCVDPSTEVVPYLYPGMKCSSDKQCIGKDSKCDNLQCTGLQDGQDCTGKEDWSCDVGLACRLLDTKYKCQEQIPASSQDKCENDYQCVNSAVCRDGRCTEYFSLSAGSTWNNDQCERSASKQDHACASFTCDFINNQAQCINPFDYEQTYCASKSDCEMWTVGNGETPPDIKLEGNCLSSYNTQRFCEAASGSSYALNYIKAFKLIYKEDQGKCHTKARFNEDCWEFVFHDKTHVDLIYSFLVAKNEFEAFPQIQTGDKCTEQLDFFVYYDAKYNDHEPSDFSLDCPLFECANDEQQKEFQKDDCVMYKDAEYTFLIKDCQDEKYCNSTYEKVNSTCIKPQTSNFDPQSRLVGQKCSKTQECQGEAQCKSGRCQGLSKGKECKNAQSTDCDVGLACIKDTTDLNKYKCLEQLKIDTACEDTLQCVNFGECRDGKCTQYFYLPLGRESNFVCTASREDLLCESMTCEYISETQSRCTTSFTTVSQAEPFLKCGENIDCKATNSLQVEWKGECRCSMSETQSYCSAATGDEVAIAYKKAFQAISGLDQDKCHSSMRRNVECWENKLMKDETNQNLYSDYTKAYYEYYSFPVIQKADKCAIRAYYNEWYTANHTHKGDNAFMLVFTSFLLLLFI